MSEIIIILQDRKKSGFSKLVKMCSLSTFVNTGTWVVKVCCERKVFRDGQCIGLQRSRHTSDFKMFVLWQILWSNFRMQVALKVTLVIKKMQKQKSGNESS
jgi:hypothetical protein